MTWKLNREAYNHAVQLIESGHVTDEAWEKPRLEDFKDLEEYALYHLAVNPDADPDTAAAYGYPYGRDGKVYLAALRAIRSAAAGGRGATANQEIFEAAGRLLDMANEGVAGKAEGQRIQDNLILKVDEYRRLVSGPVLVPGEPDADGDVVTPEQVEEVAHRFLEDYQNVDIMHRFRNVARPVESYVLDEPRQINGVDLPAGTWMMTSRITDDDVWDGILSGRYTGYSITAVPRATKDAQRRTTLRDIGWPFDVVTVSIVDNPAVPKARFLSLKHDNGGDTMDEKSVLKSIFQTLKGYFESEEEKEASEEDGIKEEVESLKSEINELKETLRSVVKVVEDAQAHEPEDTSDADDTPAGEDDEDYEADAEKVDDEPPADEEAEAQAMKGQIGGGKVTSVRELLAEEIGVDRFGRPLN